jgi:hypothetical protein
MKITRLRQVNSIVDASRFDSSNPLNTRGGKHQEFQEYNIERLRFNNKSVSAIQEKDLLRVVSCKNKDYPVDVRAVVY